MHKSLVFVAGSIAGAIALPATVIFVKPVRTKIVDGLLNKAKIYLAAKIVDDAEFRDEMIEVGSEVIAGLMIINEHSPKTKEAR